MTVPAFGFSVPTAIRFGDGVLGELDAALPPHVRRVALIRGSSGRHSDRIAEELATRGVEVAQIRVTEEPSIDSVNAAAAELSGAPLDVVIACGGGAVLDAGKAIAFCSAHALRLSDDLSAVPAELLAQSSALPLVAIPTTAGTGAEVTANAVLSIPSARAKVSLRGPGLIPHHAFVDPELLATAPKQVALWSGLDAIVQTVEAYTSIAATPFTDALTYPNIEPGLRALRATMEDPDSSAWRQMAWTSLTSGIALANSGLGAAHGLASVVGGSFPVAHGLLCGTFFVPVLRQNLLRATPGSTASDKLSACANAIADVFAPRSSGDRVSGFEDWLRAQDLPGLRDFGVAPADLPDLAERSARASSSQKNACMLPVADYHAVLTAAL